MYLKYKRSWASKKPAREAGIFEMIGKDCDMQITWEDRDGRIYDKRISGTRIMCLCSVHDDE